MLKVTLIVSKGCPTTSEVAPAKIPAVRSCDKEHSSETLRAFSLLQGQCTICNSAQAHRCNRYAHVLLKPVRSERQHKNCRGGDGLRCKGTVLGTVAGYSRLSGNLQRKLSSKRRKISCFLQMRCV